MQLRAARTRTWGRSRSALARVVAVVVEDGGGQAVDDQAALAGVEQARAFVGVIEEARLEEHRGHAGAQQHVERALLDAPIEALGEPLGLLLLDAPRQAGRARAVGRQGQLAHHCPGLGARGVGFGRFLSYQVQALVRARKLRVVLDEYEPPPVPVSLVFAHARLMSARARAFVDFAAPRLSRSIEAPRSE